MSFTLSLCSVQTYHRFCGFGLLSFFSLLIWTYCRILCLFSAARSWHCRSFLQCCLFGLVVFTFRCHFNCSCCTIFSRFLIKFVVVCTHSIFVDPLPPDWMQMACGSQRSEPDGRRLSKWWLKTEVLTSRCERRPARDRGRILGLSYFSCCSQLGSVLHQGKFALTRSVQVQIPQHLGTPTNSLRRWWVGVGEIF